MTCQYLRLQGSQLSSSLNFEGSPVHFHREVNTCFHSVRLLRFIENTHPHTQRRCEAFSLICTWPRQHSGAIRVRERPDERGKAEMASAKNGRRLINLRHTQSSFQSNKQLIRYSVHLPSVWDTTQEEKKIKKKMFNRNLFSCKERSQGLCTRRVFSCETFAVLFPYCTRPTDFF